MCLLMCEQLPFIPPRSKLKQYAAVFSSLHCFSSALFHPVCAPVYLSVENHHYAAKHVLGLVWTFVPLDIPQLSCFLLLLDLEQVLPRCCLVYSFKSFIALTQILFQTDVLVNHAPYLCINILNLCN